MFKAITNDFKSAAASFIGIYLARVSVAVPFLVALGLATAAIGIELTARFGAVAALWLLAGGFCAIGLIASFAVTMKEQHELEAEQDQERNEGGIGEIAQAAASLAAMQLPAALLGAVPSLLGSMLHAPSPSTAARPLGRMLRKNMPLVVMVLLVALLLLVPIEQEAAESEDDSAAAKPGEQQASPEELSLHEAA